MIIFTSMNLFENCKLCKRLKGCTILDSKAGSHVQVHVAVA